MSIYASSLFAMTVSVAFLVTICVAAYTYGAAPLAAATATASALSLIGWIITERRESTHDPVAFNLYIATVVALIVLYAEQWFGGFISRLQQLYPAAYPPGVGITQHAFVAVFPLASTALLLLGALAYYHGAVIGRIAAWFTFAWGAVAGMSVYAYPLFAARTEVLPGWITAPLPLIASLFGIRALARSNRT